MHLLVLSAFRHNGRVAYGILVEVSMHLLVLSAFRLNSISKDTCQASPVSMHLLVLSAFRRCSIGGEGNPHSRLNAPFGAQCFPT